MRSPIQNHSWPAAVAALVVVAWVAIAAAQSVSSGAGGRTAAVTGMPAARPVTPGQPQGSAVANPDRDRIKALDDQIKGIRDQFKSQADPLQAQLKALRDKLDSDLKPLEDERHNLILNGESPALRDLDNDETGQLAALADREKADVEKVHQSYADQRNTLKASFEQKRRDLRANSLAAPTPH